MNKSFSRVTRTFFPFSLKDMMISVAIITMASLLSFMLQSVSESDSHVPLIFVLAVLLISRLTTGYLFGLLASAIAVIMVNYSFTYPYMQLDFTMTGYPLTFICMFGVSAITCTLTAAVKRGEQSRLETEREHMRANLLRAISHDFRTPLTTISGSVDMMIENIPQLSPEDIRVLLTEIKEETEWLNNIVDNILSITRFGIDARQHLHKQPEIAEEILAEAVSRFRRQTCAQNVSVSIDVPEEILVVPADAMLLEQVIINLLVNAAVHGKTTTQIRCTVSRAEDMALFCICDNGDGISPVLLPHLFDTGSSAYVNGRSDNDHNRFMGIGLSVCKTIIEAHGGTIQAENTPYRGAMFSFTLPLEDPLDHDTQSENTSD